MTWMRNLALALVLIFGGTAAQLVEHQEDDANPKVQIALLLDTSGSMDGLIEQAKAQLWKIVNELARSKRGGKRPAIELALYEYGKSSYPASEGYLKQLSPFTTDLDLVSELLFALTTNGGEEYCGEVIQHASLNLDWSKDKRDLRLIFIAGNEEFNQASKPKGVDYKKACEAAAAQGIRVNTIFCGDCKEGERILWKDGAVRGKGQYLCINHNAQVKQIDTPFDDQIEALNDSLNQTYIGYGRQGQVYQERQRAQDKNAKKMSKSSAVERAASKSSGSYNNASWDLVDAKAEKGAEVLKDEEALPEELKKMSLEERQAHVEGLASKREVYNAQIRELSQKRQAFIAEARRQESGKTENTLDEAMLKAVREQAQELEFVFD